MDALFDWERFRATLEKAWPWTRHDAGPGHPSWDAVCMFKVLVVGKTKDDVSDATLEDLCRYHARVVRFLELHPGVGPDAKTIHKYRKALAKRARSELLLEHVVYNMRRLVHLKENGSAPA